MNRHVVCMVAVLAVVGTASVASPALAQHGPPRASRPSQSRPYSGYPQQPYGYDRRDAAFERGWADGYERGFDAARGRDRYDPLRHRWYRSGDRGYGGWYGPRDWYRDNYRLGFHDGYERGYREGRMRRGGRGQVGGWIGFGWRF